jgi:hypothetical protein
VESDVPSPQGAPGRFHTKDQERRLKTPTLSVPILAISEIAWTRKIDRDQAIQSKVRGIQDGTIGEGRPRPS